MQCAIFGACASPYTCIKYIKLPSEMSMHISHALAYGVTFIDVDADMDIDMGATDG